MSPVLIKVEDSQLMAFARVDHHRESYLTVTDVTPGVDGLFKFVGEVFGDLKRNGEHHIVFVKDSRTLDTCGKCECENVDISVLVIARDLEGNGAMLILLIIESVVEADGFLYCEAVYAAERVISVIGGAGGSFLIDNDVLCGNGIALAICFIV